MTSLRSSYNHLKKYEEFNVGNLFTLVTYHSVAYDPVTFTEEEFKKILAVTTDEKGIGRRKNRSYYKEWLPTSFKLGLLTRWEPLRRRLA
ncbi:MAG: hypothetical protein WCJ26_01435 [bacterium]